MKVIAVLPAYNAERTLEKTIRDIPEGAVDEIILVDDCSRDGTAALSRRLGLTTIVHERNRGYGGNQKTCYREALKRGAEIVIMIHPDYQYDARLAPVMSALIANGICDFVCGNRIRTRWEALEGGMPVYKYFFNRALTIFENSVTGQNLGEWHSGLRAYSRRLLETIPWELNSDDFVFDQQMLIQAAAMRFKLGDVPVAARYFAEASSIDFRRSCVYGLSALATLGQYALQRAGLARFELLTPKAPPAR
ncbi:MAG: glycosyltransferase family 2 protein [Elusimicrobia bacterium]|nr:glycosyltransferase family 2 protein [Elusimicrobiota bacterium]MDE2424318.1 glycosyltransferase family 2 protein [Elusimicrobiota bacterium]